MSVEIRASIICDGCGHRIDSKVQTRTSNGSTAYWEAKREAKKRRWLVNHQYGPTKHYCQTCADGAEIALNLSKTGGVTG